ncbi:MAG: hypothetical protein JXQ97_00135 [Natronospirillum sp.]
MKKLLLAAAVAVSIPSAQAIGFFDFEVGVGGAFNTLNDGSIGDDVSLTTNADTSVDLDLEAKAGYYLQGRIGMPVLPDLKVRYETLRMESGEANGNFDFFGTTFNVDGEAILDMTHLDTALVFGPKFIPFVDYLDVGVNLRWLLGGFEAEVDTPDGKERVDQPFEFEGIPAVIPMIHLAAATTIPVADVQLSGALNTFPVAGLNMTDWNLKARYYAPLPTNILAKVGVEAGYRKWTIDINGAESEVVPEDAKLEFDASGFFLGAVVTF